MDEFEALKAIDAALEGLDEAAQDRALLWIGAKYGHSRLGGIVKLASQPAETMELKPVAIDAKVNLSVRAIAQKLDAKSAGDVLKAAAASLSLVQNRERFSWKDLLAEAGKATGYWTKYHPTNAAQAAKRLRKDGLLVELANGDLALSPTSRTTLIAELGGA